MKHGVSIIGCGRVGTALAVFLARAGYPIAGLASKTVASAENAAALAGTGQVFAHAGDAAQRGKIVFITTPDGAIQEVFETLAAQKQKAFQPETVVFHCSGALSSSLFSKVPDLARGSIHPLQSFAPHEPGQPSPFKGVNISVEGDDLAVVQGTEIIRDLGGISFTIPTQAKTLYHAAAVVASNYLVTIEHFAVELLKEADLSEPRAYEILEPLISGTLANIGRKGTMAALTGPVARGDDKIVAAHLADLEKKRPDYLELYKTLGRHTLKIAEQNNTLDPESQTRLTELLRPGSK
ncbi:MAG: DUF2520 domain-containing protein [Desulfobacterium sp.]|jgi:predicted short-subunit dehydrogenase-like oxidoreductase (DUF2520 family)|nr:DUF2520 domain-containing protein [Desulfobacterium sp.]